MEKLLKIQYKRREIFFLIGYALYVFAFSFLGNVSSTMSVSSKVLGLSLLLISAVFENFSIKRKIAFFLVFCVVSVVSILCEFNLMIALFFLFVLASKNIEIKHLVKIDFWTRSIGFFLTLCCYYCGAIGDASLSRFTGFGWQIRHSLGYNHPNTCFFIAFVIACDFLYLMYPKIKIRHLLLTMIFVFFVQQETLNRTGFLLIIFLSVLFALEQKFCLSRKKIVRLFLTYGFLICALVSYGLMKLFAAGTALGYMLNQLITMRLSGMTYYWQQYGPSLLPQKVIKVSTIEAEATGERAYILDNLYFNFFITIGLLYGIMFGFLYYKTMKNLVKQGNVPLCLILFIFAVFGVTEGITINVDYNYFFAIAASMLFYHNFGEQKRGEFNA